MQKEDNLFEFRNYILGDLIERGYKYIARDKDGAIFAYSDKPTKDRWLWDSNNASDELFSENISLVSRMFTDIKWEDVEPFEIPYTNWKKVPVDTKVIVTGLDGSEWKCHFFKKVSNNSSGNIEIKKALKENDNEEDDKLDVDIILNDGFNI